MALRQYYKALVSILSPVLNLPVLQAAQAVTDMWETKRLESKGCGVWIKRWKKERTKETQEAKKESQEQCAFL